MKPRTRAPTQTVTFEVISGQTTASWPAYKTLYSFESYPVFGESDSFRGVFRPNHGALDVVRGTILFVSSRTTTFVFVSLDFDVF
ncbi:hypothetical protein DVH24_036389 [Malus domestica]|uniref:Uncharacterized protein n=1 Tax=Malus domestica TaxID=3750 RepID=A0A498IEN8_MALDO|nr:hypothetical protein DVH24_036389 [Malus domestica]